MNDYEMSRGCAQVCEPKEDNMTVVTDENTKKIKEALSLVWRVRLHLFGIGEPKEDIPAPQCYREAIQQQNRLLDDLCCELEAIARGIGL